MILAIGLVVDDAIVVVENTERNMTEFGLSPKDAAKRAMTEVTGPVIAIVLVLNAVFIPVAFLGGITGQLYKQFAITIAVSVVFSGIIALTLSPALAALLIKAKGGPKRGFFRWFDISFERVTNGYVGGVKWFIRHWALGMLAVLLVTVGSRMDVQKVADCFRAAGRPGLFVRAILHARSVQSGSDGGRGEAGRQVHAQPSGCGQRNRG